MRHLREALFFGLRFMVAVRRAPSGAPVSVCSGLLTCVRLPPIRLVANGDSSTIPNSVNLEAALAQASDLLRCMGATANEAGNGLHGAQRDVVLSIVHLAELARAYVDKSLDCLVTH